MIDLDDINILIAHSIFTDGVPYDPAYDIAPIPPDGVVDIVDVFEVGLYFGQTCSVE